MRSSEAKATQSDGSQSGLAAGVGLALAVSAGVHAGLVPEHLSEAAGLGVSFVVASGLLLAVAAWVAIRPGDRRGLRSAQLLIAGLLVAYVASRTVGIPVLQPELEHTDALGLATKAVELFALLCALRLGRTLGDLPSPVTQEVAR